VRKKHALFKKYGADFLYAQFDKKDKGKLARRLVSSSLKRGPQMKYSKDISAYIEQRYGIVYSIRTINQMRR
jgi:hypothetical protein